VHEFKNVALLVALPESSVLVADVLSADFIGFEASFFDEAPELRRAAVDELRAELGDLTAVVESIDAASDPISRLENHDLHAGLSEFARCDEAGHTCPDDENALDGTSHNELDAEAAGACDPDSGNNLGGHGVDNGGADRDAFCLAADCGGKLNA
jgi:hypothetical protein